MIITDDDDDDENITRGDTGSARVWEIEKTFSGLCKRYFRGRTRALHPQSATVLYNIRSYRYICTGTTPRIILAAGGQTAVVKTT